MIVYSPELIWQGDLHNILLALATAIMGVFAFACGVQGYLAGSLGWVTRLVMIGAGLLLIKPGLLTDAVGLGVMALVWFYQRIIGRRKDR
jgi:TRAP-type uncharacterized transport system fused permease subunit